MSAAANMPDIKSGLLIHISELDTWQPDEVHANSVRILGRIRNVNLQANTIVIEYHNRQLLVDAKLIPVGNHQMGHMYQFLGELEKSSDKFVLKARVSRKLHGIDTSLYDRCLAIRRKFESTLTKDQ